MGKAIKKFIVDSLEILLLIGAIFLFANIFLGQLLIVTGNSMAPTLLDKEQILGEKMSLNFKNPKRGEIVIFRHPEEKILVIKRIVGLPNETFEIKQGKIFTNGQKLEEPYARGETSGGSSLKAGTRYQIPSGSYVVLGDNRQNSMDSRTWGFLSETNIVARAVLVYYPWENLRLIKD